MIRGLEDRGELNMYLSFATQYVCIGWYSKGLDKPLTDSNKGPCICLARILFKFHIPNSPEKRDSHKMFTAKAKQVECVCVCVWQGNQGIKKRVNL